MELQRLTEELLLTVTSLNRSCIPQSVQEHLKGENFLLSYLDEHGGCVGLCQHRVLDLVGDAASVE